VNHAVNTSNQQLEELKTLQQSLKDDSRNTDTMRFSLIHYWNKPSVYEDINKRENSAKYYDLQLKTESCLICKHERA